jgi:hypothetical protein
MRVKFIKDRQVKKTEYIESAADLICLLRSSQYNRVSLVDLNGVEVQLRKNKLEGTWHKIKNRKVRE